jgi:S-adenosylmethionine decarboxylase
MLFEGPEKRLFLQVRQRSHSDDGSGAGKALSLRQAIPAEEWTRVLRHAQCTILSCTKAGDTDSYVLSESSLFVWDDAIMLKTCGTTTLLKSLGVLWTLLTDLVGADALHLHYLTYSRKRFVYPHLQHAVHASFGVEAEALDAFLTATRPTEVAAKATLGTAAREHWHVYTAGERGTTRAPVLELMMHELRPTVNLVYDAAASGSSRGPRDSLGLGLGTFCGCATPCAVVDEFRFEPFGYSANALCSASRRFATVHVTPQAVCSYASVETDAPLDSAVALVARALAVFRPLSFHLAVHTATSVGTPDKVLDKLLSELSEPFVRVPADREACPAVDGHFVSLALPGSAALPPSLSLSPSQPTGPSPVAEVVV